METEDSDNEVFVESVGRLGGSSHDQPRALRTSSSFSSRKSSSNDGESHDHICLLNFANFLTSSIRCE